MLEGWASLGHNAVHQFIGGSMSGFGSPNDPAFFLHHAFVDYIYMTWQNQHGCFYSCYPLKVQSDLTPEVAPLGQWNGTQWMFRGQLWTDTMWPFEVRVMDVASSQFVRQSYNYDDAN
jgi:hypothetical protein